MIAHYLKQLILVYIRHHYGPIRMRDALGNSLNIPAIRAIKYLGVAKFLQTLHGLGFTSLTAHNDYYGEGLALGNGAITLFELVQAYTSLANKGSFSVIIEMLGQLVLILIIQ